MFQLFIRDNECGVVELTFVSLKYTKSNMNESTELLLVVGFGVHQVKLKTPFCNIKKIAFVCLSVIAVRLHSQAC